MYFLSFEIRRTCLRFFFPISVCCPLRRSYRPPTPPLPISELRPLLMRSGRDRSVLLSRYSVFFSVGCKNDPTRSPDFSGLLCQSFGPLLSPLRPFGHFTMLRLSIRQKGRLGAACGGSLVFSPFFSHGPHGQAEEDL